MHILLFLLFFVLFAGRTLGLDLSLAPGLSVKNAFLYLIFGILAIETALTRGRKLEALPVLAPFALYVLYAIFSWVTVLLLLDYPAYSLRATLISLKAGPVEGLLVLLIFFYGLSDRRRAIWLLAAMTWTVIVGNLVTVVDTLDMPDLGLIGEGEPGRTGGPIGHPNEFAAFVAMFVPAMVALIWTSSGFKRWLAIAGLFVSGVAFLMAVSRGAIVGLAIGAVGGAYFLRKLIPARMLVSGAAATVVVAGVFVAVAFVMGQGELLVERFKLFAGSGYDASSGRTVIWGNAIASMMEKPITFITGYGWHAYETSLDFHFATHNEYLNILYNLGAVGLGLFLLSLLNAFVIARTAIANADAATRPFLFAFVFGFLSLLVTLVFSELYSTWLFAWAFVGISMRIAVSSIEAVSSSNSAPGPATLGVRKVKTQYLQSDG